MKIIITLISVIVIVFVIGSKIYQGFSTKQKVLITSYKIILTSSRKNVLGQIAGGIVVIVFLAIAASNSDSEISTSQMNTESTSVPIVVRKLGGENYKTIFDGEKIWLAEDLQLKVSDSWCYNNGGTCKGRIYTKAAAAQACWSIGYRLPTDQEWKMIAEKLSDRPGYRPSGFSSTYSYNVLLKKGRRFFNAQLNGKAAIFDNNLIEFSQRGMQGYYWSASASESEGYTGSFVVFDKATATMNPMIDNSALALSCRCVKD